MSAKSIGRRKPLVERHPAVVEHWAPLVAAAGLLLAMLYVFERSAPMTFSTVPTVSGEAGPGQRTVVVDWGQDWKKLCPGTASRTFEGSHGEIISIRPFDVYPPTKIGTRHQLSTVYVPKTIGPGMVTLRSTVRFRCNAVQELWPIIVQAPPVAIMVRPDQTNPPSP